MTGFRQLQLAIYCFKKQLRYLEEQHFSKGSPKSIEIPETPLGAPQAHHKWPLSFLAQFAYLAFCLPPLGDIDLLNEYISSRILLQVFHTSWKCIYFKLEMWTQWVLLPSEIAGLLHSVLSCKKGIWCRSKWSWTKHQCPFFTLSLENWLQGVQRT